MEQKVMTIAFYGIREQKSGKWPSAAIVRWQVSRKRLFAVDLPKFNIQIVDLHSPPTGSTERQRPIWTRYFRSACHTLTGGVSHSSMAPASCLRQSYTWKTDCTASCKRVASCLKIVGDTILSLAEFTACALNGGWCKRNPRAVPLSPSIARTLQSKVHSLPHPSSPW